MRATLEQLKAMSDEELYTHWLCNRWPFDGTRDCGSCLSQHGRGTDFCSVSAHAHLRAAVPSHTKINKEELMCMLRGRMEEFYALRLFYDALYPQTVEAAEEKTIAESAPSLVAQG